MKSPLDKSRYAPVAHPDRDLYRVPVWVSDDEIAINLGRNTIRYYTHDTLPDKVKSLIAMVNAFPPDKRPEWGVTPTSAFVPVDNRQRDIGWRVTDELYILVLDEEFLKDCYVKGVGSG